MWSLPFKKSECEETTGFFMTCIKSWQQVLTAWHSFVCEGRLVTRVIYFYRNHDLYWHYFLGWQHICPIILHYLLLSKGLTVSKKVFENQNDSPCHLWYWLNFHPRSNQTKPIMDKLYQVIKDGRNLPQNIWMQLQYPLAPEMLADRNIL